MSELLTAAVAQNLLLSFIAILALGFCLGMVSDLRNRDGIEPRRRSTEPGARRASE